MERTDFERMAVRLRPLLLADAARWLPREEAEDVVQDTLCRLWLLRDRLDAYHSKEGLARTVGRHLAQNRLRDRHATDGLTAALDALPDPSDSSDEAEARLDLLMQLVDQLPGTQQAVLRMKHIDGLEVDEIARLTGSHPDTVRQNLSRARRKIREQFLARQRQ